MKISSHNEWDPLKSIIVGDASYANWPMHCPDYLKTQEVTFWKETPIPKGPVKQYIIDEAQEDLQNLSNFLESVGVKVYRPTKQNFQDNDGFYNYCPRDRLLIIGSDVIDTPMTFACRNMEISSYDFLNTEYIQAQGKFDAANICRLNDDLLYLISTSGDYEGFKWLTDYYSGTKKVYDVSFYGGFHIDSTIVPVREGLVVLNGKRVTIDTVPEPMKNWDKIWINDMEHKNFIDYPVASNWIGLNFLTVDPKSVVCDPRQENLRRELDRYGVDSHGIDLRHSRTLGGGHHCATLDLVRDHNAESTTSSAKL